MTYPGGKNGSGVYQKIINEIPPHDTYIEAFYGGGAIMKHKRPALCSIGIDVDGYVIKQAEDEHATPAATYIHGDAISYLARYKEPHPGHRVFVYLDPPYPEEVRKSKRDIYRCEFKTQDEHAGLLWLIKQLPYKIAISSYDNDQYNQALIGWRKIQFTTTNRAGQNVTETLWMNYPEPDELHDYRYLGENYREREVIAKRKRRWIARLQRMDRMERYAMLDAINQYERREA